MKDTRFIELVNLYIDRQIEPADAAELEADIQTDPHHRQIYREYCRMHRATKLVYESFRAHADKSDAHKLPGSIERFAARSPRSLWVRWNYILAGLAAAACLTVALMRTGYVSHAGSASGKSLTSTQAVSPAVVAQVIPRGAAPAKAAPLAPGNSATTDYTALLASMHREDQRAYALMQAASLHAVSLFDDSVFDGNQTVLLGTPKVFPAKPKTDTHSSDEFTAFQFQR
jgi:anti-sigma factor RsiW